MGTSEMGGLPFLEASGISSKNLKTNPWQGHGASAGDSLSPSCSGTVARCSRFNIRPAMLLFQSLSQV